MPGLFQGRRLCTSHVQEVGANELTGLCTVVAAHGYIEKVRSCFLSPWLTRVVEKGLLRVEDYVAFLVSDVDVDRREL